MIRFNGEKNSLSVFFVFSFPWCMFSALGLLPNCKEEPEKFMF